MAEQEGKQALIIQLPWTVPQQPNVQTIVLQQPAKTQMELNTSTDKTAISSFALSVAIALILGALATWLAYWYGRKSFDLTKQSFDAVIKQIESSEKITIETNQNLIRSQNDLSMENYQIEFLNNKYDDLKKAAIDYLSKSENYRMYIFILGQELRNFQFEESSEIASFQRNIIVEMRSKLQTLLDAKALLRFSLYNYFEDSALTSIVYHIHELDKKAFNIHANLIHNEKERFDVELANYQQYILDVEATLIEILKSKSIVSLKNKPV